MINLILLLKFKLGFLTLNEKIREAEEDDEFALYILRDVNSSRDIPFERYVEIIATHIHNPSFLKEMRKLHPSWQPINFAPSLPLGYVAQANPQIAAVIVAKQELLAKMAPIDCVRLLFRFGNSFQLADKLLQTQRTIDSSLNHFKSELLALTGYVNNQFPLLPADDLQKEAQILLWKTPVLFNLFNSDEKIKLIDAILSWNNINEEKVSLKENKAQIKTQLLTDAGYNEEQFLVSASSANQQAQLLLWENEVLFDLLTPLEKIKLINAIFAWTPSLREKNNLSVKKEHIKRILLANANYHVSIFSPPINTNQKDAQRLLGDTPLLFDLLTPIEKIALINAILRWSTDDVEKTRLKAKMAIVKNELLINAGYQLTEAQFPLSPSSNQQKAQLLLYDTSILYDLLNVVEKTKLLISIFVKTIIDSKKKALLSQIISLAQDDVAAAIELIKNNTVISQIPPLDILKIICDNIEKEKFRTTYLQVASISVFNLVSKNIEYAEKIFNRSSKVISYLLSPLERYKIGLHWGKDFIIYYLPVILFDSDTLSGSISNQQKFQGEIEQLNKSLINTLNNNDLLAIIIRQANTDTHPNFMQNLNFCLEKTGTSLAKKMRKDKNFADRLLSLKNTKILIPILDKIKIVTKYGEEFFHKHLEVSIELATEQSDEATTLFSHNFFINHITTQITNYKKDLKDDVKRQDGLNFCLKIANIMKKHHHLPEFSQRKSYDNIYNTIYHFLLDMIDHSNKEMENIFKNSIFDVFFDEESKSKFRLYKNAFISTSSFHRHRTEREEIIEEAKAKEQLMQAVENAMSNINDAYKLLYTKKLYDQVSPENLATILVRHIDNEFFYNDLNSGNFGVFTKEDKDPLTIKSLALKNKEAAVILLANIKTRELLDIPTIQRLNTMYNLTANSNADHTKYYQILGLQPGATAAQIKIQYRKLVKTVHPDQNPHAREGAFNELNTAYTTLLEYVTQKEQMAEAEKEQQQNKASRFTRYG